jgi:hypothetical protein
MAFNNLGSLTLAKLRANRLLVVCPGRRTRLRHPVRER